MIEHPDITSLRNTGYDREQWKDIKKGHDIDWLGTCQGCGKGVYTDEEHIETVQGYVHDDYECLKKFARQLPTA